MICGVDFYVWKCVYIIDKFKECKWFVGWINFVEVIEEYENWCG